MIEKTKKQEEENAIIIAGKGLEVYDPIIVDLFQGSTKVKLKVTEGYKDRAIYIAKQFEAFGILPVNGIMQFEEEEQEIIAKDKSTFNGTIYSIILERPQIKYKPEKVVNIRLFKEDKKDNILFISDKSNEIYILWIIDKFQCNNQIEIQVKRREKKKAMDIIKKFEELLIFPESGFPMEFKEKEVEIKDKEGNLNKEKVLSITLTKLPEIYKYTKDSK